MEESKLRDMTIRFQQLQQQFQAVAMQKENTNVMISEIDRASEEIEANKEADVFKMTGTVLIKTKPDKLLADLEDKKTTLGIRVKALEKQEEAIRKMLSDIQAQITGAVQGKK